MKKSKFLTVCFGACFGAGQMYLGLQKKGLVIMSGTAGFILLAMIVDVPELLVFLPVIWFYALFDALNAYMLPMEARKQEDDLFFQKLCACSNKGDMEEVYEKRYAYIGWICLFIGGYMLCNYFITSILSFVSQWMHTSFIWRMYRALPRLAFAIVVLAVGYKFVKRGSEESTMEAKDE